MSEAWFDPDYNQLFGEATTKTFYDPISHTYRTVDSYDLGKPEKVKPSEAKLLSESTGHMPLDYISVRNTLTKHGELTPTQIYKITGVTPAKISQFAKKNPKAFSKRREGHNVYYRFVQKGGGEEEL